MKKCFFFILFTFCLWIPYNSLKAESKDIPLKQSLTEEENNPSNMSKSISKASPNGCPELTGRVVRPEDADYDQARLVSNYYTSKNKHPAVIVYSQNTQDVQNAVKWARCQDMTIRVRSGGHNHEAFSTGTNDIVIDVSEMKQLHINKSEKTVVVQPGVTGQELYTKLFRVGLTQVGGTCAEVGISGLILTGGMGPLLRKHGMACDNLLAIEIVDAKGNIITATRDNEYKDLFWASQGGGGGNFGVVTSLTLKVYPADSVTWFNIGWDWNQPVQEIITTWQNLFSSPDKKWFSHLDIWAKPFPAEHFKKQPIKVMGVFWGKPEDARKELASLLKIGKPNQEIFELVPWDKAIKSFEDSTAVFVTSKPEYKSTGAYAMEVLPDEANKIITETLKSSRAPLFNVLLFSLGGAANDIKPSDTAYYYRNAKFFITYAIQWLDENDDIAQIGEVDKLRKKLLPYTEGDYIGNPDKNLKDYLQEYYGDNVGRLQAIKTKYDPDNFFQHEQSIPPLNQKSEKESKAALDS